MLYRGTIVEVKKNSIIVMTEGGTFEKIKKIGEQEVGMEVYFEDRDKMREHHFLQKSLPLVAAIFLLIVSSFYGVGFWQTNFQASALITVDINPSIELKINKQQHVIQAKALNADGANLALDQLKGVYVLDALKQIIDMAQKQGYVTEGEENYVLMTAVSLKFQGRKEDLQVLLEKGQKKLEEDFRQEGKLLTVVAVTSDKDTLKKAHQEQTSLGRMEMYQRIKGNDGQGDEKQNSTLEEVKTKKVKELIEESGIEIKQRNPAINHPNMRNKNRVKELPPGLKKKEENIKNEGEENENPPLKEKKIPPGLEKKIENQQDLPKVKLDQKKNKDKKIRKNKEQKKNKNSKNNNDSKKSKDKKAKKLKNKKLSKNHDCSVGKKSR